MNIYPLFLLSFLPIFANGLDLFRSCPLSTIKNNGTLFHKISAVSKYFTVTVNPGGKVSYLEAKETCEKGDLEMGEVRNQVDQRSLQSYPKSEKEKQKYWIGLNDLGGEKGLYKDGKGHLGKYQVFKRDSHLQGPGNCVVVTLNADGNVVMLRENCEKGRAKVLCQFREGSFCDVQSFQGVSKGNAGEKLIPLGESKDLFVSTYQASHDEALRNCLTEKKIPLFLNDSKEVEKLHSSLKTHLQSEHLNPDTQFWTGGRFEGKGGIFHDVLELSQDLRKLPFSVEGVKGCLDVSLSKEGKALHFQGSNCNGPKFFICMEAMKGQNVEELIELTDEMERGNVRLVHPLLINLSQPMRKQEVVDLLLYIVKNDLASGKTKIKLRRSLNKTRVVIETIFSVILKAVSTEYVGREVFHIAREIVLLYLNNQRSTEKENENALLSKEWGNILTVLENCGENITKSQSFESEGFRVTNFRKPEDIFVGDVFIDIFWLAFSFSLSSCFPHANNYSNGNGALSNTPIIWAADYYSNFFLDFIQPLLNRWGNTTDMNAAFSLLFGDLDFSLQYENLESIVHLSYVRNGIENMRVIRPIK